MRIIKIQINNVAGLSGTRNIMADSDGVPLDRVWRKRLRDAKIDNCIEIIKPPKSKATGGSNK